MFLIAVAYLRYRRHGIFPKLLIAGIVATPLVVLFELANMTRLLTQFVGVQISWGQAFSGSVTSWPLMFYLVLLPPLGLIPYLVRLDRGP